MEMSTFRAILSGRGCVGKHGLHSVFALTCINMQGGFLTKAAHNSYTGEVLPFQKITCLLNVKDIKRTAFNLFFRFYNEDSKVVVSEGYQTVVFINLANKKISKLPAEVIEKVRRFEAQEYLL